MLLWNSKKSIGEQLHSEKLISMHYAECYCTSFSLKDYTCQLDYNILAHIINNSWGEKAQKDRRELLLPVLKHY